MLDRTTIPIGLSQGLDTKTDAKQVIPGKLLLLENAKFTSLGQISKRFGYTALPVSVLPPTFSGTSSGTISAGSFLNTLGSSLVMGDGTFVYTYSETNAKWSEVGSKITAGISTQAIGGPAVANASAKSVFLDSYREFIVWSAQSTIIRWSLFDHQENTVITTGNYQAASGVISNPVPLLVGTKIIVLLETGTDVTALTFDTPYTGSPTVTTGLYASSQINGGWQDATVVGSTIYVVTPLGAGTAAKATLRSMNSSLTILSSTVISTPAATDVACVSIYAYPATTKLLIEISSATTSNYVALDTTSLPGTATATVISGVSQFQRAGIVMVPGSTTQAYLYGWLGPSSTNTCSIWRATITTSQAAASATKFISDVLLVSKPVLYSTNVLLVTAFQSTLQPTYYGIVDPAPRYNQTAVSPSFYVFAKVFTNSADQLPTQLGNMTVSGTSVYFPPLPTATSSIVNQGSITATYTVNSVIASVGAATTTADFGRNLYLGGSSLNIYDGADVVEVGFNNFPEKAALVTSNAGTGIGAGTYEYVSVYRWVDGSGNVTQSAPSTPLTIILGTAVASNVIKVPIYSLSNSSSKLSNTFIDLYRTTANGTISYKVTSVPNTPSVAGESYVSITDTQSDSNLIGNQQLYTNGGEVENISPPATNIFTIYKNRVVLVPSDNTNTWWYSKQLIPGFPAEFSDLFTNTVDYKGGAITALGVLDDKLIFFKENLIYYIVGDGPAPSGASNDFSPPQIVSSPVGCINHASVVSTPKGLIFQSNQGIYLLDRGLNVSYIGYPVESYNSYSVISAKLLSNSTEVRFILSNPGVILNYDYLVDQWGTFTISNGVDATVYKDSYTYLTSTGVVGVETPGYYKEVDLSLISLKLTTSWLSLAKIQGFQRVRRMLFLGDYKSNTTLTVKFAYDFDSTVTQTDAISITASATPLQYRIHLARQKCESVQITLYDTPTPASGTEEGLTLSSLMFEAGVKKGANKVPGAKSYG
jgi:hypothetical protein